MNSREACAQYFKQHKGWERCFALMRKKWESLGRTGGRIVLENCTQEERQAIGRMMGRAYREENVEISLSDFEDMLQTTRFAPTKLHELLEEYFGCAINSNQDKKKEKQKQREEFFGGCMNFFAGRQEPESVPVLNWIAGIQDNQRNTYTSLLRESHNEAEAAKKMVCMTGEALIKCLQSTEEIPIAVLAAAVSGNPHYLDRGCTTGNLFMQGLCFLQDKEYPQSSLEWKDRLLCAHILPDDISSMVTVLGIHLQIADRMHPAVEAFCDMREPVVLTALNLKNATGARADGNRAYVVENEMVFTYLADKLRDRNISLLCTSGQLRNCALELLQLLVENDTEIYYSGDMDPEGMGIADRLWQKYPEKIHIWRMYSDDYLKAVSREKIDDRSLAMLRKLKNPTLQDTAIHILKKKKAAYQENILTDLLQDFLR